MKARLWALSNTLKCLGRLCEFSAVVKYLTVTVQKQLKIFMSTGFEHAKYASLIQYHSLF